MTGTSATAAAAATTATTPHTYAATGTYTVTLTVTDDSGATDTVTHQVVAEDDPRRSGPLWRATARRTRTPTARPVTVPAATQVGDRLVLFVSANKTATLTTPAAGRSLGTVSDGTDVRSWVLTRVATAGLAGTSLPLTLSTTPRPAS